MDLYSYDFMIAIKTINIDKRLYFSKIWHFVWISSKVLPFQTYAVLTTVDYQTLATTHSTMYVHV